MSGSVAAQLVRPPVGLLLALLPGVAALAAAIGAGLSVVAGEADVLGVLLAGMVAVLTALLTPGAFAALGATEATKFPSFAIAISCVRLATGTGLALAVWLLSGRPEMVPFWMTFLLASLATLVVETLVMIAALRRATVAPAGEQANGGAV